MMRRAKIQAAVLLAITTLISAPTFARFEDQSTPTTQPTTSIAQQIQELGAEDWSTREAAQANLVERGPEIIEQLQTSLAEASDPEVRSRLETAIAQINENEQIGASVITLNFVDAPLEEVISSLNRQARCNIGMAGARPQNAPPRLVTVQLDHVSFWQAIEAIEAATGLYFNSQGQVWVLERQNRNSQDGTTCESGPFQFIATEYKLTMSYASGQTGVNLFVLARAEPKIKLAPGRAQLVIDKAIDDNGNDLANPGEGGVIWLQENANGNANIPLSRPANTGSKIAELSGHVELSLATRVESMHIDNLSDFEAIERRIGSLTLRIEPATEAERAQLQAGWCGFSVSGMDNVNRELVQQRLGGAVNTARVTDSKGRPANRTGTKFSAGDVPGEFRYYVTYMPADPGDTSAVLSLQLDIAAEFRSVTTHFTFKDLPLP